MAELGSHHLHSIGLPLVRSSRLPFSEKTKGNIGFSLPEGTLASLKPIPLGLVLHLHRDGSLDISPPPVPSWHVSLAPQLPKGKLDLVQGDSFAVLRGGAEWELGLSFDEHWTHFFFIHSPPQTKHYEDFVQSDLILHIRSQVKL